MKILILLVSFLIELTIALYTAFFKISDLQWSLSFTLICIAGIISAAIFLVIAIGEIISSKNIKSFDKITWIIGLVLLFNIIGIVYLVYSRKHIVLLNA